MFPSFDDLIADAVVLGAPDDVYVGLGNGSVVSSNVPVNVGGGLAFAVVMVWLAPRLLAPLGRLAERTGVDDKGRDTGSYVGSGGQFRFGEEVTAVDVGPSGTLTTLASGKQIPAETVMYSAGRQGQTEQLELANAGLEADSRGRIFVDDNYQTKVEHIYAVGDVIGFPALAATSMDQGRLAAYHAFDEPSHAMTDLQPIGIYSIPEISYVGATEVELTKNSVPYEVGTSRYRELARGQIAGDSYGMLKLLVSTEDLKLLGVHIFGTNATEMVHIGQAVMGCGGTIEYLVDAVFNYPTFSEAYKVAALDVMNKLRALSQFKG